VELDMIAIVTPHSLPNNSGTAADARAQIAGTFATCLQNQWFLNPCAYRGPDKVEPSVRLNPSTYSVRLHSRKLRMPGILGYGHRSELMDVPNQPPEQQYRNQSGLPNEAEKHQIQTVSIRLGSEVAQTF
jgi:hypothetical protein